MEILVATHNLHKKEEIQQILGDQFLVKSLADYDLHDEIVEDEVPQYLQLYLVFSLPSYNLCFPFPLPNGCLWQEFAVKLEILELFVPQYSQ